MPCARTFSSPTRPIRTGALAISLGALALSATLLAPPSRAAQSPETKPTEPAPRTRPADAPNPAPAPPLAIDAAEITRAIQRGVTLLVERQETYVTKADANAKAAGDTAPSEWPYQGVHRDPRGEIPIGYRIGGTSISAIALLEVANRPLAPEVASALERALTFVLAALDDPAMKPDFEKGYDTRGWGHAYGLAFLLELRDTELVPAARKRDVDAAITKLVKVLADTEIGARGGWNYSRPKGDDSEPSTFMTAPTLQILFEAARQGEAVDKRVVERALKTLEDARLETGAFQYGTDPEHKTGQGFEAVMGATGRMAVCESTLYLAGRGTLERVRGAVDAFFAHWEWLELRRKQTGTHVAPYGIAPYYFFFAHRYVAQAIELLPGGEKPEYRRKLVEFLWRTREESGGWNDRVFPRSEGYGTAMTLLALHAPAAAQPAAWGEAKRGEPKRGEPKRGEPKQGAPQPGKTNDAAGKSGTR